MASEPPTPEEARASLTDPEARWMRCADGAARASYNVQIAATTDYGFVTAIMATEGRNDSGKGMADYAFRLRSLSYGGRAPIRIATRKHYSQRRTRTPR